MGLKSYNAMFSWNVFPMLATLQIVFFPEPKVKYPESIVEYHQKEKSHKHWIISCTRLP